MFLLAGLAFGQGRSLDQLIKNVKPLPECSTQQDLSGAIIRTMAGEVDFNCVRSGRESAGVVRLRNPDTGDELEGEAGKDYYYKVPNRDRPVGTNRPIEGDPNVTELEQIR
jgi:hypothetical protein